MRPPPKQRRKWARNAPHICPHTAPNSRANPIKALLRADPDPMRDPFVDEDGKNASKHPLPHPAPHAKRFSTQNEWRYVPCWMSCVLVGLWRQTRSASILRWSSTNGTGASILAAARMGIACVSLRRGGAAHSFPYFNSGLLQQRGPPAARTPVKAARSSPCQGTNIPLNITGLKCSVFALLEQRQREKAAHMSSNLGKFDFLSCLFPFFHSFLCDSIHRFEHL